jgi:predicted Rossmann fold nucleotide-binding protein DprA/Smf involved in DNA uptake
MPRKRKKPISFDVMVKFFLKTYEIPTKKDIDKISSRIDHLEQLILKTAGARRRRSRPSDADVPVTASDTVLEVIKDFKDGVRIDEIQARTGYEKKKLRNILYRLHKDGKIHRKERGVYIAL